ncbi:hypothetical protein ABNQ39_20890 [Azospirillum sp. A26]|uniref:hypothetical protein n=1 Tax=Azospirillum sp. A26 TaxID=3160607 RepID=UPI00366ECE61
MADLTEQQFLLLSMIDKDVGKDLSAKDWAPVMSGTIWTLIEQLPEGLVETHQRFAPILPAGRGAVMGVGFVRLTDAGRAAISNTER